ncbi:PAS domain-containing protein [Ramlibacter aurantiacus]|uniref:PAS domain-containing protein n=1 Tax=Ramlibacter aurantiacus TaxID=2801330 RepID=UPI001918AC89|nr:PAS domain-containing protein [Ramlibacter aurantiacus]
MRLIVAAHQARDREWIVELLRLALADAPEFIAAPTGESALAHWRQDPQRPQVLIAAPVEDLEPDALIRHMLDPTGITGCPVVMITPGHGRESGPALLRAGAQDYIGESWLSPYVLARAVENAGVRWAAERELREARHLLQAIVDGAGALVFAKDLQGRYFLTNQAWRERLGFDDEQAVGVTDDAVFGPSVAPAVRESDRQVLATGERQVAEETFWRNGQRVTYLASKFPLADAGGRRWAVCGVATDVTSLKEAQAALEARERALQTLADNTPDILLRFDAALRHVFVSAAVQGLTGRAPREFLGRGIREAGLPVSLCELWEAALRMAFHEGRPQTVEFRFDSPAGPRHLTGRFVPEFDPAGRVEQVLAVLHDDTERQRAAEDLRRRARVMARLADASRLIHASLSAEEIARVLVEQARDILGTRQAVVDLAWGDEPLQVVSCDHETPPWGDGRSADGWPGGSPARGQLTVALTNPRGKPVGQVRLADRLDGEFDADAEAVLVQLAAIASTSLENARLYAALRLADQRKTEFIAILAHELRNPLAPIRNGLEILRRKAELRDSAARARDMMERQLGHLVRLVDDLLDVSRISRGKIQLQRSRVNLQAVIDSALEATQATLDAHRHELALEQPHTALWTVGDYTRLVQVMSNLFNNAAKYTPTGGRITVQLRQKGREARIRVSDNGAGIPGSMLPHIFELFTQVRETLPQAQGGLGIGLSLVRQLVQLHGGRIEAHSDGLGLGSRFTLYLPLDDGGATAPADELAEAVLPGADTSSAGPAVASVLR